MRGSTSAMGLTVVFCALGSAAAAQEVSDGVRLRNDCRLAAQVLTTGHPAPQRLWALQTIGNCRDHSGTAVPAAWNAPPPDQDGLAWLVAASVSNRDARILDAVMAVAANRGAPRLVRLSAAVLARLAELGRDDTDPSIREASRYLVKAFPPP
jgi:hypothetical protein